MIREENELLLKFYAEIWIKKNYVVKKDII